MINAIYGTLIYFRREREREIEKITVRKKERKKESWSDHANKEMEKIADIGKERERNRESQRDRELEIQWETER